MKTVSSIMVLLGTVVISAAQTNFTASLVPLGPDNYYIPGGGAFYLDGPSVNFRISLGHELYGPGAPTTGRLSSTNGSLTFELGSGSGPIHFPLPWPPEPWSIDYGGSVLFSGSFVLEGSLREDFVAGRMTLVVLGSETGDFSGAVLPASPPEINRLDRQGSSLGIIFPAEPPYRYTVEGTTALGSSWSEVGFVGASSRRFEAVVNDSIADTGARFYRIRRE